MMIRKTLTILSLIGLLLSVGLWIASNKPVYFDSKGKLQYRRQFLNIGASDQIGLFPGYVYWIRFAASGWGSEYLYLQEKLRTRFSYRFWDFRKEPFPTFIRSPVRPASLGVCVPLWNICAFFCLTLYLLYLPVRRRRKREKLGLCIKCGYDLRGSKERCPECNTPFDPTKLGQEDLRSWRARFLGTLTHYSSLVYPLLMIFVVLMAFVIGSCLP